MTSKAKAPNANINAGESSITKNIRYLYNETLTRSLVGKTFSPHAYIELCSSLRDFWINLPVKT